MYEITSTKQLEAVYGIKNHVTKRPVNSKISPYYKKWIEASRFAILCTVGEEGTNASLRGDIESIVEILDEKTLLLPDWGGNNQLDSLRNIIKDPRASLLFMINGQDEIVAVNGTVKISTNPLYCNRFSYEEVKPRTVLVLRIDEVYYQCAKAIKRADLWHQRTVDVPSSDDLLSELFAEQGET